MDQLLRDIEAYAAACGRKPQWVLRRAVGAGWGAWDAWRSGASTPTLATVERLHAFMRANPPPAAPAGEAAA